MSKSGDDEPGDDEPGFSFANFAGANNYQKWAREMRYSLESARLWDHTVSDRVNPKPVAIVLKDKNREDDAKLERQEKRAENYHQDQEQHKRKGHIGSVCLGHIQQEFQAVKTDWLTHDLWEWLK